MKLVVDASVAVAASATPLGFERFRGYELVAPALLWIEATSVLHELLWRRELDQNQAERMRDRVLSSPVERIDRDDLAREAWTVAEEMGWAKTYDAHYVGLARLLGCRLVTLDARLRSGTARLGFVVGPHEL